MAKVQYHINPETGRPNQCTATVRSCKYATDGQIPEHYETKQDARDAYEKTMSAEHGEVKSLTKEKKSSSDQIIVEGFDNFDAYTAEPTNFDAVSAEVYGRFLEASFDRDRADRAIQGRANEKVFNRISGRYEYKKDTGKVLAEFRQQENPSPSDKVLIDKWNKANDESIKNTVLHTKLDQVYRKRGSWNRAYLVPDGHLHKSMDCSTCNKGNTPTKFQWMTDYSGKSEKEIVGAAGYRACTTCYPSAPVGDASTLPSKMMTQDEEVKAKEQAERKAELAKKKVDASNKAPTVSGKPLTAIIGRYKETFKTERSAAQWYVAGIADGPPRDENEAQNLKNVRYKVLYNLALKHDKPLNEIKEEFDKKAEAKSKRDYKASVKHFEMLGNPNIQMKEYEDPTVDTYDVPEELMNKSPREWDNANQYIPED